MIVAPNGRRVEFNDVSGAGIVGHKIIRIFDGNIVYGFLHSRAIGELRAADPTKLSGETTTRMIIEGQPEWRADASFDGDLDKLPVSGKLQTPFRADLRGELLELATQLPLDRQVRGAQLRPARLRRAATRSASSAARSTWAAR